jgi:hypothetical protein
MKIIGSNVARGMAVFGMAIGMLGCGKGSRPSDGKASAALQLNNTNSPSVSWQGPLQSLLLSPAYAATLSTPSAFRLKLIAAYLAEDIDPVTENNIGMTSMFYINPECGEDLMHCNVADGTAEDGLPYDHIISTFFDFTQGNVAVNQALNAQDREIEPGTYRYVRLEFCKQSDPNAPNASWQGGLVNQEVRFTSNNCVVNSAVMDPPLVLKDGDSAIVQLSYDYSDAIRTGADAQGSSCTGEGDSKTCFQIPTFVPSVI